jgi:hypothetical protein
MFPIKQAAEYQNENEYAWGSEDLRILQELSIRKRGQIYTYERTQEKHTNSYCTIKYIYMCEQLQLSLCGSYTTYNVK